MSLTDEARREVLRQLDRDVDARHGVDRVMRIPNDGYPVNPPSPFWTFMEGKTECPECGSLLNVCRLCPHGCLDELEREFNGDGPAAGCIPGTRDRRGWLRK